MNIDWTVQLLHDRCEWGSRRPLPTMYGVSGRVEVDGKEYGHAALVKSLFEVDAAKACVEDVLRAAIRNSVV